MAYTLWLSAEEERILERIMRHEGTRTKEQAVIKAIRDKGAALGSDRRQQDAAAAVTGTRPSGATPEAGAHQS
jgi:hypothetical protein